MSAVSLDRVFAVLHHTAEHGPLTVEALAAGTGLPPSTAHRQVVTLTGLGYLTRSDKGARRGKGGQRAYRYAAGPRLVELARRVSRPTRSARVAVAEQAVRRVAPQAPQPWVRTVAACVLTALDSAEVSR